MNSVISFRGKPISTSSHSHADVLRLTKSDATRSDGSSFSRRYDCEGYLDCLFRASVVNATRLPCKDCGKYSPKFTEEERANIRFWT
jgi:hypothetical protein